jgi:anti-anti-sigma factor
VQWKSPFRISAISVSGSLWSAGSIFPAPGRSPLQELADSKTNIVVDRSGVDFIASLGMRSLVVASKTLARNARMLVLLNPTPLVADALTKAGLHALLPMVHSDSEAQGLLSKYSG